MEDRGPEADAAALQHMQVGLQMREIELHGVAALASGPTVTAGQAAWATYFPIRPSGTFHNVAAR